MGPACDGHGVTFGRGKALHAPRTNGSFPTALLLDWRYSTLPVQILPQYHRNLVASSTWPFRPVTPKCVFALVITYVPLLLLLHSGVVGAVLSAMRGQREHRMEFRVRTTNLH